MNCFWVPATQVPQNSCLGFTGTGAGLFVASWRETCLKPHSKNISTWESSLAFPCSSSLTDPITFSHAIWLLSEARKLLNRETFKGHSLRMCALYVEPLLQRKGLLHIFSSCSGPPGDDSSIAVLSCLLTDSVSTFTLQILEDLISTL